MLELLSQKMEMNKLEKERNERKRVQLLEMMRIMGNKITGLKKKVGNKIDEKLRRISLLK